MKSLPASHFFAQFTGKHPSYLFAPMGALSDLGASLPCFGCAFSVTPDHKKDDFAPFASSLISDRDSTHSGLR
jgi:hypothetical protein